MFYILRISLFFNWKFVHFHHLRPVPPLPSPSLWEPQMGSSYMSIVFLRSHRHMEHIVSVFVYLAYFAEHNALKVPCMLLQISELEDGGGIGWGDHFLPHKFIERSFEC